MKYEKIKIDIPNAKNADLTLYIQDTYKEVYGERLRPMILICPGGGYGHLSVREAEPIALQFLSAGCQAAVLHYDVLDGNEEDKDIVFPLQLFELAKAISIIRGKAEELNINKDKILIAGFSAGGHLAGSIGCFWNREWLKDNMKKIADISPEDYRPNGLILAYPVITAGQYAHRGSFEKLLRDKIRNGCEVTGISAKEIEEYMSLENQVSKDVPPVFMWHTFEDQAVPLQNSLFFAEALKKADVNFEYHVFPHGGHGTALGTEETVTLYRSEMDSQIPVWIDLCKKWIDKIYKIY